MQILRQLVVTAYGMHMADQIAIVAVPLIAALLFKATPEVIGLLVACQALAHLLGSIPAGVIVDRALGKGVVCAAALISMVGFIAAAISVVSLNLVWFAITVTIAGFGIVLFVIASLSIIPIVVQTEKIAAANSKVEMARAIAMFVMPLSVGWLASNGLIDVVLFVAALLSGLVFLCALRFPTFNVIRTKSQNIFAAIVDGGRFVWAQQFLRPIATCAIFWNFAFSAMLAVLAPFLLDYHNASPDDFGVALSVFGGGMIAGAWVSGRISDVINPNIILIFGPSSSAGAVIFLAMLPAEGPIIIVFAAFFILGFGPMMWMVAQNSVRQLVTPPTLLGRVNAVIQTAIYGTRPLGAIAGGAVAGAVSPHAAVTLIALLFTCSALVAIISPLRSLYSYKDLQISGVVME